MMSFPILRSLVLSLGFAVVQVLALVFALLAGACSEPGDEPIDPIDQTFVGPKSDGFCVAAGSKQAKGVLAFVNSEATTYELLDDPVSAGGVGLNRLAAESIVAGRPFASLDELDGASYVGVSACAALVAYACVEAQLCAGSCDPDAFATVPKRTPFGESCRESRSSVLPPVSSTTSSASSLFGRRRWRERAGTSCS